MTLTSTLARTLSTSGARPSMQNGESDLKGITRQRMRTSDGKRAASKDDIEKDIIRLLATPQTPSMLAAAMNRASSKSLYRDYLVPMLAAGKIEKSGDYYKRAGVADVVVQRANFDDIVKKSAFAQLPRLAKFIAHMKKVEAGQNFVTVFRKMCTGRLVPNFKCHPDDWTGETTQQFIRAFMEHRQISRIGAYHRQAIRYVHEDVLQQPISKTDKNLWGVDGKKDKIGQYAHVRLTESQIIALSDFYLAKGDLEMAGYIAVAVECFGRPKSVFDAETRKFQHTERTITRATIQGWPEPIYESKLMPVFQALALRDSHLIKIETFKAPAIEGQLYESKTEDLWPKRILGAHNVKVAAELLHERRGKPTLFNWQGLIHRKWEAKLVPTLKDGYREIGLTADYFFKKPMYALRHVGAQMWLNRTGYDYAGVAEMGWRDIATLHRWYGGYSMEFFNQKVAVAYA